MKPVTREEQLIEGGNITPVTREEQLIAGVNITPVTREEMFLKDYGGGGGDVTIEQLDVTENGVYSETGKAYSPVNVNVQPVLVTKTITANGTYNASSDDADGYSSVTVNVQGYAKKSIANTPTPIATFNASELPMPSLSVGIEPVQAGNGDPSPTNVRPISGWSAVNVPKCGKNLYKSELNNYYLDVTTGLPVTQVGYEVSGFIPIFANQSIYIPASGSSRRWFYDKYKNPKTYLNNSENQTYTAQEDGYIRVTLNKNNPNYSTYQIEYGTTATEYEPYNGQTYTTTLKDGQGNPMECYGGQLVNENGVQRLDDTHNSFDMGSVSWSYYNLRFFTKINDIWINEQSIAPTDNQLMCEIYKTVMYTNQPTGTVATWNGYIYVKDDSYNGDITAFRTAVTGYKIAYELATPQQIPQDSLAIATQEGTNNLWADSGDIQSGEYLEAL